MSFLYPTEENRAFVNCLHRCVKICATGSTSGTPSVTYT